MDVFDRTNRGKEGLHAGRGRQGAPGMGRGGVVAQVVGEVLVLDTWAVVRRGQPRIVKLWRDEEQFSLGRGALRGPDRLRRPTHTLLLRGFLLDPLSAEKSRVGAESRDGVEGRRRAAGGEGLRSGGRSRGRGGVAVTHRCDGVLSLPLLVLLIEPRPAMCVASLQPRPLVRSCCCCCGRGCSGGRRGLMVVGPRLLPPLRRQTRQAVAAALLLRHTSHCKRGSVSVVAVMFSPISSLNPLLLVPASHHLSPVTHLLPWSPIRLSIIPFTVSIQHRL